MQDFFMRTTIYILLADKGLFIKKDCFFMHKNVLLALGCFGLGSSKNMNPLIFLYAVNFFLNIVWHY